MKKIIGIILSLTMLLSTVVIAAERDITVSVDGKRISFDVLPQIIDGRTMVPIRAIFEAMGAEVEWNDTKKTAICKKGSTNVSMTVGRKTEIINGKEVEMDIAPVVINDRTLAPARYVAEAFGYNVVWNGTLKTVIITSNEFDKTNKYDDVTEHTIQIQQFTNQKMYIEAMDLCGKTKTEKNLSPADAVLIDELLEAAQSSYNSYLTKTAFEKVNSYMNSKMYLEAIAACDEAIDKSYISEQDNIRLKEIKAEAQAKYSVYHAQNKKQDIIGKWTCLTSNDPLMSHHAIDIQFKNDGTFYLKTWRTQEYGTYSITMNMIYVDYSTYYQWAGSPDYMYDSDDSKIFQIDGNSLVEYDDNLNVIHRYYRGWTN